MRRFTVTWACFKDFDAFPSDDSKELKRSGVVAKESKKIGLNKPRVRVDMDMDTDIKEHTSEGCSSDVAVDFYILRYPPHTLDFAIFFHNCSSCLLVSRFRSVGGRLC